MLLLLHYTIIKLRQEWGEMEEYGWYCVDIGRYCK